MMKYIMKIAKHLSRPRRFLLIVCRKLGIDKTWSDEKYVRVMYRAELGRKLNLENPRRFTEKMQWLKLYNQKEEYTVMVDKYEAPKYVAQKIGEQYIILAVELAVVDVARGNSTRRALAERLVEGCTGNLAPAHVCHE